MTARRLLLLTSMLGLTTAAMADPGVFLGIGYTFGDKGGIGLTLKVTSTKKEDKLAAAAGVTWYPQAKSDPIGFDIGAAYIFDNWAAGVGWDFLHSPQVWAGGGNTDERRTQAPAPGGIPGAPGGGSGGIE